MVHGCGKGLEIFEVEVAEDGIKVCPLGKVHSAARAVTFDFDTKHPMQLTKVSDLNMLVEASLEVINEADGGGDNCTVVHMYHDDSELTLVLDHLEINSLINGTLLETEGDEYAGEFLIPLAARLLEAIKCFDKVQNTCASVRGLVTGGMMHIQHLILIELSVKVCTLDVMHGPCIV